MEGFADTPAGPVPRVATALSARDWGQTFLARAGFTRDNYKIVPGLYCVGRPDADAPVIATANYKLTFDAVRRELAGADVWILVLDTHGINVWCAAGKGTFATDELAHRVRFTRLAEVVAHREIIVPQLGAPGVSAHKVRRLCGFKVRFGPVYAHDLPAYLAGGADPAMREVRFSLYDRAVLVPVEFTLLWRNALWALVAVFVLSGIGPGVFSLSAAWGRGLAFAGAGAVGVAAGAGLAPLLLPWLPHRMFAVKGAVAGVAACLPAALWLGAGWGVLGVSGMALAGTGLASYLAMNFTGSTPYTSPSGVEREMRRAIPLQAAAVLAGLACWVASAFTGGTI